MSSGACPPAPQAPEDILISLDDQYHLLRFFHATGDVFTYVVLDRAEANLALARR